MSELYTQLATLDVENGVYTIEVDLGGGSGRASITSPCTMIVENGEATATLEWSSSNYDYMIVNGEKILRSNKEGNSTFEVPVYVFDEAMEVIGDTTAMSTPHEIEYSLTFHSDTIQAQSGASSPQGMLLGAGGLLLLVVAAAILWKKRGKSHEE